MDWNTFWSGGTSLPITGVFLRVTILYFTLLLMTRLMGPRQVGIVSAFNFIIHAGMAHVATARMVNPEASLTAALTIILTGYSLSLLLSWFDYKFPSWVGTNPLLLIKNGQIIHKNLKKAHLTIDDLLAQLRLKNIHNLSDVSAGVLEPMGGLSTLQKSGVAPITKNMLHISSSSTGLSTILIYDGELERNHLYDFGLQESWLEQEIAKKGFTISQVLLATLESTGNIHVSVKST